MKASIADSDLIKLKNTLKALVSTPGDELLDNNCVNDGFNFKIYLYSDRLEKKIFVGNYYDERVDQLTALFESHLLKSGINIFSYYRNIW